MSLFFFKSPIWSTEKFETYVLQMNENVRRYRKVEQSSELKEVLELEKIVTTKEFKDNKKFLLKRKYRKTEECQNSRRFQKVSLSADVHKYNRLSALQERDEKQQAKLSKLQSKQAVQDYIRLKDVIASEQFKKDNAFWSNPRRWYTTEECKQDERYTELMGMSDIQFFLHADAEDIARWETYAEQWSDNVDKDLAASDWKAGFAYKGKAMKAFHSFVNERQAYNEGNNISRIGKVMKIQVRYQNKTQAAWNEKLGFVSKDFEYTSDVAQTAEKLRISGGMLCIKVRCAGGANHVVCLKNEDKLPIITLFQSNGQKVQMGIQTESGKKLENIKGFKPQEWHFITLVWNKNELIWFVNNHQVLRMPNTLGNVSLFLQAQSFISEQQKKVDLEGQLELTTMSLHAVDEKFNYLVK